MRRSILLDAKADLVVYGMGERPLVEIVKRLAAGETMHDLRDLRGVAYRLGAKESEALLDKPAVAPQVEEAEALLDKPAVAPETDEAEALAEPVAPKRDGQTSDLQNIESIVLPSYEEVVADNKAFAAMTRTIFRELNPFNARRLVQFHGREAVVVNPPSFPLDEAEMDRRLRLAVHATAASELRQIKNTRLRGHKEFDSDRARLFRRLLVLFDHRTRRPHHPKSERGVDFK